MTKQRTFYVDGQKIKIVSRRRANGNGFTVNINGESFYSPWLEREKAEDHCYVRWVKNQTELNGILNKESK